MTNKLLLSSLIVFSLFANAKEVEISKTPVLLKMPVGEEVRVDFPETVVNLNINEPANSAIENLLLKPDGVLFWTAKEPFKRSRVLATTVKGDLIVIDIETGMNSDRVLKLNYPKQPVTQSQTTDINELMPAFLKKQHTEVTKKKPKQYSYTDMAAFAIQHYIGPRRLIDKLPAVRVKPKSFKTRLVRVWNAQLRIQMKNQWVLNNHYITALKVKNTGSTPYRFDPRALRGSYLFVASLHDVLPPSGSTQNETIWVFITDKPFHQAFKNQF